MKTVVIGGSGLASTDGKEEESMNSRQPNDKSGRKNVVRGGLWGALLLATAAFFAMAGVRSGPAAPGKSSAIRASQSGVRSGSAASEKSSTIRASQSPAADPAGPNIARAETDTLDLQLD